MPFYRVDIVRMDWEGDKQVMASYSIPEGIMAEVVMKDLSVNAIMEELKRRLRAGEE